MTDDQAAIRGFGGVARLFPLPNLVLFPQVVQGLHVFEPRYRQLTADALADDRLITIIMLSPGWEADYEGRPVVEAFGCLGRITHHEPLPDGRSNLRLRGLARLRLLAEQPAHKLYRTARAEVVPDVVPEDLPRLLDLRRGLADAVLGRFVPTGPAHRQLGELFAGPTPLGALCDMLAYALPIELGLKQRLLEEPRVDRRAEVLAHALRHHESAGGHEFPPAFSPN
ncbi:MAG TPA: LON peptidase substrate-binding domain-containing protein [Fimbriiglobus sp.]|nr:LON peptidase substrate-binding domain-containing protein [Fimbriiglobus sp.]